MTDWSTESQSLLVTESNSFLIAHEIIGPTNFSPFICFGLWTKADWADPFDNHYATNMKSKY